jgi:hypothetical protein
MKKPPPGNQDNQNQRYLLNQVMAGASEEAKAKVLQILYQHGIDPDDPMFLALLAVTDCRLAVAPIPEQLANLQEGIKAVLKATKS